MATNLTDPDYVTMTLNVNTSDVNGTGQEQEVIPLIELYKEHAPLAVGIDRLISPLFYLIGLPSNPLSAYIWLGSFTRRSNSSAIYLGALSVSHTVFLVLHIFIEVNYAWGIRTFDGYVWCELFYILYYCPQYLAPLLVLGFTVERYIAVCHPFVKGKYCTVRRAVVVVVSLLVFCLLLSSVQGYLWTYDETYQCCNHRQVLQQSEFPYYWTWVTELAMFGFPPLAALVFNILVIREIRGMSARGPAVTTPERSGNQNQASTITLLSVSFYLICTWLPATLVYSLERKFPFGESMDYTAPDWRRHFTYITVRKFVEEATLSNCACYFFIYYVTGKHFRTRFKEVVCPKVCFSRSQVNGVANGRSMTSRQYIAVPCSNDKRHSTCVSSV